jgi:hypothetical protein
MEAGCERSRLFPLLQHGFTQLFHIHPLFIKLRPQSLEHRIAVFVVARAM